MTKEPNSYRRLPGIGAGAFEYVKLYLGSDHLLLVSSSGYTENYKRFYFRDIQAITLRQSLRGKVMNAIWGFLVFLPAMIALQAGGAVSAVWSVIAGIFLLLLAGNIVRGPTCVCQIQTAVQTRTISSLNRLRRARKVLAQLKPLIEAVQGPLTPEDLLRHLEQAQRGFVFTATADAPPVIEPATAVPPVS